MRRHRLTGRTPRDDQSTDGRDAAARQGSQGWKGTIGSQQEARRILPRVSGGVALVMPWIPTSSLQNSERIYFCCSKPPSQWDFIPSALSNESTSFLFSRHARSFSITELPYMWFPLPIIFFPETQGWRGSFRSWLCTCCTSRTLSPTTSSYDSAWFPLAQHWAWAPTSLP